MKHKTLNAIADLHMWPNNRQGDHELDRECQCEPTVEATNAKLNDFRIWHKD